jgi:hypothetical protein
MRASVSAGDADEQSSADRGSGMNRVAGGAAGAGRSIGTSAATPPARGHVAVSCAGLVMRALPRARARGVVSQVFDSERTTPGIWESAE